MNVTVEQHVNIITVTQSKSGGGGSFEMVTLMLLLLLLLQRQGQKQTQALNIRRFDKGFVLFAGLLILGFNTHAAEPELGWYIGGQLGTARTAVSRNDIETTMVEQGGGIDGEIISLDTSDTSYQIFGGYQFDSNISVQVDYIDWGDRKLGISGGVNIGNLDDYYAAVASIHPESGNATRVSGIYTLPLEHGFSVAGKVVLLAKWVCSVGTVTTTL